MSSHDVSAPYATRYEKLYGERFMKCYASRPKNLDKMLVDMVEKSGGKPAIEDGSASLSYRELDRQVNRVATGLASLGVAAGDRVALFLGNRFEFVTLLFGVWRLGAVVVPIGIRQSAAELTYMVKQSGAKILVYEDSLTAQLPSGDDIPTVVRRIKVGPSKSGAGTPGSPLLSYADLLAMGSEDRFESGIDDQAPACIMYTSGTTGYPKGAILSHLGFFHTARHYEQRFRLGADERMLLTVPASHISGLLAVVVVAIQVGGCIVSVPTFKAQEVLDEIETRRVTAAVMVPAMYNLLLMQTDLGSRDLSSWRIGHFGGAAMPEVTIQRLARAIPSLQLYNGFGATETTSAVTLTSLGETERYPDSVGTVVPCVDILVLDEHGQEVATGQAGELWIRSPGNAIGYWNNPDATKASFVSGYWRSGDVGSIDAQGHLRVFDRIKDMINRGGHKIYCVELENLVQSLDGAIEVAAVASPCPVLGERIHVFIHALEEISAEAVRQLCRDRLADYKEPDFITFSDKPLPRNLNGKLIKAPLRERAAVEARIRTENSLSTVLDES